jgi:hypothetical protein
MVTGMIDRDSYDKNAELQYIAERDGAFPMQLNTCHILNDSTMQGIDPAGTGGDDAENKVRCDK